MTDTTPPSAVEWTRVTMSAFNEHQQAYMRELSRLPPAAKCGCGWYPTGECPHCTPDRGGYERCGAAGSDHAVCSRKSGHGGPHWGWPKHQVGGSMKQWTGGPCDA